MDDIALVLSGGGAKGAFEAGVIHRLVEGGVTPTVLAGTSAGALNAAALAVGMPPDELVEMWTRLRSRDVYRPRRDVHRLIRPGRLLHSVRHVLTTGPWTSGAHLLDAVGWSWLFDMAPLRRLLVDALGSERLDIPEEHALSLSVLEAETGRHLRFCNRLPQGRPADGYVCEPLTVDHVLASAAIPGLFRPPRIGDYHYWDGGLVANTPLQAALPYGAQTAIVVATGAVDRQAGAPRSAEDVVSMSIDHLMRYSMVSDLNHARTVNELVAAAPEATYHQQVRLVPVIPPERSAGVGRMLDFHPKHARDLVAAGEAAGQRALDDLERA